MLNCDAFIYITSIQIIFDHLVVRLLELNLAQFIVVFLELFVHCFRI